MARILSEAVGHHLTEDIMTGMREWRIQHPKATLREIETELDARLARTRARMLQDLALQSTAASWQDAARLHAPPAGSAARRWLNVARIPTRS
jgi:hypothetical protein